MGMAEIKARKAAELAALAAQNKPKDISEVVSPKEADNEQLIAMGLMPSQQVKQTEKVEATVAVETPAEPLAKEPEKKQTFAERLAAKRASDAAAKNGQATAQVVASVAPTVLAARIEQVAVKAVELSADQKAILAETDSEELAQAYSDIALKLNSLAGIGELSDLSNAMTELKQALKKNPSASLLLLDTDIGQMVLALTRILQVDAEEQSKPKEKKPGKAKIGTLTPEQLAAAFDEM